MPSIVQRPPVPCRRGPLASISRLSFILSLACLTLAVSPVARSQTQSATDESTEATQPREASFGEEIVVTARRRAEDPQTIPISLTTFSAEQLEQRSLDDLSELSEQTANLDITITGGFSQQTSEAAVFIRGVGQIDTAIFSDPGVGIYVDGVYLARAQGAVLDLLELDRVEILRGPQGTLFGKNTTGGAIQLITKRPEHRTAARVGATVGRFDRADARVLLDAELGDDLWASASLLSSRRDGYSSSRLTDLGYHDDERLATRLGLEWSPSERVDIYLTAEYTREDEVGGNQLLLDTTPTPLLLFYNQVLADQGFQPYTPELWAAPDFYTSFSTDPQFLEGDIWGTTADVSWSSASLGLRSITAYRTVEYSSLGEGDGSPRTVAEATSEQEQYQFSQEIHVTGSTAGDSDWLLGAIYFRERPQEVTVQRVFADLPDALDLAPGPIYPFPGLGFLGGPNNPLNNLLFPREGLRQEYDLETTSYALFGEATWALGDRTSLTTGARVTRDEKTFDYLAFGPLSAEDEWTDWSGRLSLAHQANEDLLLYASLSRGFKSGGFNGRPQQRPVLDPFDPETVVAYEAGFKSDWLERRLRLNGAGFFSDYESIHFAASFDVNGVPVFVTQNAGDAEIYGFELELEARPTLGWLFEFDLGYLQSELVTVDPRVPPDTVAAGNELPKTPEWSGSITAQYLWLADSGASWIASADYSYRGDVYNNFENTELIAQDGYALVGARLLFTPASGTWDLALFGTNLTDEEYLETGFFAASFGTAIGIAGPPREWGLSASYRF
ncbi:MAG: TonB-dependent receptor [Acidobacteriota bacterium]